MSQQLDLVGVEPERGIGDEMDRCYTPQALADDVVATIAETYLVGDPMVVEPSVGGGAFVRAARRHLGVRMGTIVGVDVDPDAAGLDLCDERVVAPRGPGRRGWPDVAAEWARVLGRDDVHHRWMCQRPDVIVGNPPFTGSTAIDHVEACLALRPLVVALILPWSYYGVARWDHLLRGPQRPAVVRPIRGRPWSDKIRETAVYEWHPQYSVTETRLVPLEGSWR